MGDRLQSPPAEALSIARGLLMRDAPWLAVAFAKLAGAERPGLERPGTDGARFFYDPARLASDIPRAAAALAHATAHCLLGHPASRDITPLAADMAAALLLDELLPRFCPAHGIELFQQARHRLAGVSLGQVAGAMARDPFFEARREVLAALLAVDDHRLWTPGIAPLPRSGGPGEGWARLGRAALERVHARRPGRTAGGAALRYRPGSAASRSYRQWLARYADTREEPREDPDAFDRNLYAYGLARYGDLPLIEPAETREARHIDELAIVIDTSGSCLADLTARFLDETRALLADEALFPRRFNLRILQCDAEVRRDDAITCLRDFERYIENLDLVGGGGTDFRPAFRRIDRLIARGTFRRLPVALFFSDGMGLFPAAPPEYETAFVFFKGRYDDIDVPRWARKLVLEE